MGERLLCKQEVDGSIPFTSTTDRMALSAIRVAPRQAQLVLRRERPGAEKDTSERHRGFRGARTPLAPDRTIAHAIAEGIGRRASLLLGSALDGD